MTLALTMDHRLDASALDRELFDARQLRPLRAAVDQLSWLLSRGYSHRAALKLVGDRHGLEARQRKAVLCCSCTDHSLGLRLERRVDPGALAGRQVAVDGLNEIILLETALAGGVVLRGRDGCLRDLAAAHGAYLQVRRTPRAVTCLGQTLDRLGTNDVRWQ